jgi:hypothetical protein
MRPRTVTRPAAARLLWLACTAALALLTLAPWASAEPQKVAGGIRFTYADPNAGSVLWAGEFNDWSTSAHPMTLGEGGVWSVVIPLPPGRHLYKFVADGQWVADPENPATAGEFGNSLIEIGADGNLVAQKATSNTRYSPKILLGGRFINLFHSVYNRQFNRFEITRPEFDIDLDLGVRISDLLSAHVLLNINPRNEDVQEYRSRLNYKRGSLKLTQPGIALTAFDSEDLGTWDDPLHLVGGLGIYHHPYGYKRQGAQLGLQKLGIEAEFLFSDNFDDRNNTNDIRYLGYDIDNFPTWTIGADPQQPRYVFEPVANRDDFPVGTAIGLLQTERAGDGFALVPNQVSKLSTLDFGDDGRIFGFGDNQKNTFAGRLRRPLPGGFTIGVLGRSDRGYGAGRLVLAEPAADSAISILAALYDQQWFGGGVEAHWRPDDRLHLYAEALRGARRMVFVNLASSITYPVDSLLPTKATVRYADATVSDAVGEHRTTDESGRYIVGGSWTFAEGDITVRGSAEYETHSYPAWTQEPVAPAGQPAEDHTYFETVEFQRGVYLDSDRELENSMTALRFGWDRNWRYYLDREVKTSLDFEWVRFDYDPRTSWEHQLWFPTGNFWLESGQHLVSTDRLTVLGEERAVRLRPRIEVPLWHARAMRLAYLGTLSGVGLDLRPRYAETIVQFGFDLTPRVRLNSDTRWVKYDAPALGLDRGYLDQFTELAFQVTPGIRVSFGVGVDPNVLDPVTNEYAYIGRDRYLFLRNANGYTAQKDYLSLAPQIAAAEQAMQDERRLQLQAVVRF